MRISNINSVRKGEMNAEEKLNRIAVRFEYCSAREVIDEVINIVGIDDVLEYVKNYKNQSDTDEILMTWYEDGEECSMGCKNHIFHPFERCGRIGARGISKTFKGNIR
jgi:hypothetical protein